MARVLDFKPSGLVMTMILIIDEVSRCITVGIGENLPGNQYVAIEV